MPSTALLSYFFSKLLNESGNYIKHCIFLIELSKLNVHMYVHIYMFE